MSDSGELRRSRIRLGVATVGIAIIAITLFRWGTGRSQPTDAGQVAPSPEVSLPGPSNSRALVASAPAVLSPDEALKQKFLGTWTHLAHGQQWIENRPDGTARMFIQFDFIASLLYGAEMHMDLQWNVKDGILSHTIQQGSPPDNVNKLIRDYGQTRTYRILKTVEGHMLLESIETTPEQEDWTRSPAPKVWAESAPSP